jgi:hypothetical protein
MQPQKLIELLEVAMVDTTVAQAPQLMIHGLPQYRMTNHLSRYHLKIKNHSREIWAQKGAPQWQSQ